MPELPEVETIKRGILPHIIGRTLQCVKVRRRDLRWPIPTRLNNEMMGQTVQSAERRGKYLLLYFTRGCLIIHLGMSGRLYRVEHNTPYQTHDHVDFIFSEGSLRYHDPRRFGAVLWTTEDPQQHPLLCHLGVEPLSAEFNAAYLYGYTHRLATPIKTLLMNHKIVVGVGNIYAAESLFLAGIHPQCVSRQLTAAQCQLLVKAVKQVLNAAIEAGGTTLKDFCNGEGKPGYFQVKLQVYGRENQPCFKCQTKLQKIILQQRTTVFCPTCQP